MIKGLNFLASSKFMDAYDIIITVSPTETRRAAGPFMQIILLPLIPLMT